MNAYERRIIHAEIQKIEGVSTNSVGAEGNRRVIIFPEGAAKPTEARPERKPRRSGERREKPAFNKEEKRTKPVEKTEKREAQAEKRSDFRKDYSAYKRPEGSRPAPRKIEKAKDLDSYFAKLKEFSSNNQQ
jgi:spoIIIJ-associated protein